MANIITDFAILIDADNTIGASLPTGTRRANTNEISESYKIIIGKAPAMNGIPFCNGISGLQFIALPAYPNFNGQFVIIGRNESVPTYWGCTNEAALIAQCLVFNSGVTSFGYGDGDNANLDSIANCKLFLDTHGYALSNSSADFLNSYFLP